MFEKAINLYTDLTEVVVNNFLISKDSPVIEPVRLHNGAEENKEALKKSKGEEDEDFQILEYQAQKGNVVAIVEEIRLGWIGESVHESPSFYAELTCFGVKETDLNFYRTS
ncbi:hypothetical protein VIGAN_02127800 [Vigna angularis var. angularis]|uniref:Uncharacterized protein n=1 Tax=Vigna angularis var. angularis TaxID=157739 RepID=A0A0S3RDD2_PHAAN|nr:hypothetical protein VIGAN_02127800 [Vigna angularis var. angularis]